MVNTNLVLYKCENQRLVGYYAPTIGLNQIEHYNLYFFHLFLPIIKLSLFVSFFFCYVKYCRDWQSNYCLIYLLTMTLALFKWVIIGLNVRIYLCFCSLQAGKNEADIEVELLPYQETGGEKRMLNTLKRLVVEEEGQGMAEYALILVAIALVCIVGFKAIGGAINNKAEDIKGNLGE